jgi:hypothetical protein
MILFTPVFKRSVRGFRNIIENRDNRLQSGPVFASADCIPIRQKYLLHDSLKQIAYPPNTTADHEDYILHVLAHVDLMLGRKLLVK